VGGEKGKLLVTLQEIAKQSLAAKCVPKHRDWVMLPRIII
jgi:hypothetical protein